MTQAALNSALYQGEVWHKRLEGQAHEFRYQVAMVYLDLAEIEQVFALSPWWSAGRARAGAWPPVRFCREDYFRNAHLPLDKALRDWVAGQTGRQPKGPIRMLCNVRNWGYVINPIVCYYLFDEHGQRLEYVIAEVTNTPWRERIQYLLKADQSGTLQSVNFDKKLYVSPFFDQDMGYRFSSNSPGQALHLAVDNYRGEQRIFQARLALTREPMTAKAQRAMVLKHPWMTGKVAAAIYWQALKLWLKRVPVVPHEKTVKTVARSG